MRKFARIAVAIVLVGLLVWLVVAAVIVKRDLELVTAMSSVDYNDAIQTSIGLLIDQSTSWAQGASLLLAGLLALWIAKPDEVKLALSKPYWPEILMWVVGVVSLLASLSYHREYVEQVALAIVTGSRLANGDAVTIPDVFGEVFSRMRDLQLQTLLLGALAYAAAPFSALNLKERTG